MSNRKRKNACWRRVRGECGDTLLEVTIALAILSMVLSSCSVVAARAFRLGQTAKERTTVANVAQDQMEALRSFRDNHKWDEFLSGKDGNQGVLSAGGSCHSGSGTGCFYMGIVAGASTEYFPESGTLPSDKLTVPSAYVEITATPDDPDPTKTKSVQFTLNYGFQAMGGGSDSVNHIQTTLANVRSVVAAAVPPPTPTPTPVPTPSPTPPPGCSTPRDVVLVLDHSSSMQDSTWAGGITRLAELQKVADDFAARTVGAASPLNLEGIVLFNQTPYGRIGLSGDSSSLTTFIDTNADSWAWYTNYEAALGAADDMLFNDPNSRNGPGVEKVVVFVSDGIPDWPGNKTVPPVPWGVMWPAVLAKVQSLDNKGVSIYPVGINLGASFNTLKQMVTGSGSFSDAVDPAALENTMKAIAGQIACP